MTLDLSPIEDAVAQLEDALVQCDSEIVRQFPQIRNQMRAGAIQAFEFTYDLSISPNPPMDRDGRREDSGRG